MTGGFLFGGERGFSASPEGRSFSLWSRQNNFMDEMYEIQFYGFECDRENHRYKNGDGSETVYPCRCILGRRSGTL